MVSEGYLFERPRETLSGTWKCFKLFFFVIPDVLESTLGIFDLFGLLLTKAERSYNKVIAPYYSE